jgi:curved DNA-binding protein
MKCPPIDHYATLGLDRTCSSEDIKAAYRALAKQYHPDVNGGSVEAMARTQAINDAYRILSDEAKRRDYDAEWESAKHASTRGSRRSVSANITEVVQLGIRELITGTTVTVQVRDPANRGGMEQYELDIPEETAPGARFRLKRVAPYESGFVTIRVKARPDRQFKPRGSDLRCDLRISARRATSGGTESIRGVTGQMIRVTIPAHVGRKEIIVINGEGLPKLRGGRGDLLVRIIYRPDVKITPGTLRFSTTQETTRAGSPRLLS